MLKLDSDIPWINVLPDRIESFLKDDVLDLNIDGQTIRGYRSPDARSIWIRDYSDMLRVLRYFEKDVVSVVQHFADTQAMNGRIFDYFTTYPEKLPCEKENWTKYVRVPVESDVEYRFVKAAWLAYQASGDQAVLEHWLPHIQRALFYSMSHPHRWDPEHGLVKRPYTIDTWDFAYTAGTHDWLQFQIDEHAQWGIFHGDNSGVYEALMLTSRICRILNDEDRAGQFKKQALEIKNRTEALCWNGRFYSHFVKLNPNEIAGFNEAKQLSLSNPITINRGLGNPERAAAMLRQFQARADENSFFAPWISIDPPFPAGVFGEEKLIPGAYINGGLFPLTGGELALMAFENGFERYGLQQLHLYEELTRNQETYLWYFPDGRPSTVETSTSPDATPTDGWGSSAMLMAMVQGLLGIQDVSHSFSILKFQPRWPVCGGKRAFVRISYACSGASLEYNYELSNSHLVYELSGEFDSVDAEILIPEDHRVEELRVNGKTHGFNTIEINGSAYASFCVLNQNNVHIEIGLDK